MRVASEHADTDHFRSILGLFPTGLVVIAAVHPGTGRPVGLTANSFTSVSLRPPLVSFCIAHTSTSWPLVRRASRYCVNILAEHQRDVCRRFTANGGDKFDGVGWTPSPGGCPILHGALGWLECSVTAEHPAGDHVIVVGGVHALDVHQPGSPLVFFRGTYGRFQPDGVPPARGDPGDPGTGAVR